jgi:peptidoglycan/xylan/chitin deacetylase (PgdA/CDA1 family)
MIEFGAAGVGDMPMLRVIMIITAVVLTTAAAARATECRGNPNALGTSRTIAVDAIEHPRVGTMQYRETLPLDDHEVVITFDDGPIPPRSTKVLEILESECVKATFFLVGEMARAHPDAVRQIETAGHTIGTHSETHPLTFHKMPEANDRARLAPFFRIPGFLRRESVEKYLASQHLMTWCADFPADDWMRISSEEVVKRALERLEEDGKGMLLLHDIHPRTVEALPVILSELKRRGYRIVHVVPASPEQPRTATDPRQWVMHPHSIWPLPVVYEIVEPSLPAPSIAMFDGRPDTALSRPRSHAVARGQVPLPPVPLWPRVVGGAQAVEEPIAAGARPGKLCPCRGRTTLVAGPWPQLPSCSRCEGRKRGVVRHEEEAECGATTARDA